MLVATDEELSPQRVEQLLEHPNVPAFSRVAFGRYSTLAYVAAPDGDVGRTALDICGDGTQNCLDAVVHAVGSVWPCSFPELRVNLHVLVELRRGSVRTYADELRERESSFPGVQVAAGLLLGPTDYSLVLELVGDEVGPVLDALLDLTDRDTVVRADTHVVLREDAHGWGTAPAD